MAQLEGAPTGGGFAWHAGLDSSNSGASAGGLKKVHSFPTTPGSSALHRSASMSTNTAGTHRSSSANRNESDPPPFDSGPGREPASQRRGRSVETRPALPPAIFGKAAAAAAAATARRASCGVGPTTNQPFFSVIPLAVSRSDTDSTGAIPEEESESLVVSPPPPLPPGGEAAAMPPRSPAVSRLQLRNRPSLQLKPFNECAGLAVEEQGGVISSKTAPLIVGSDFKLLSGLLTRKRSPPAVRGGEESDNNSADAGLNSDRNSHEDSQKDVRFSAEKEQSRSVVSTLPLIGKFIATDIGTSPTTNIDIASGLIILGEQRDGRSTAAGGTGGYDSGKGSLEQVQDSPPVLASSPLVDGEVGGGGGTLITREGALFALRAEHVVQQRRVSVEREQCGSAEHAELRVDSDENPAGGARRRHHHRAVTVNRSHTWTFQNKPSPGDLLAASAARRSAATASAMTSSTMASSRECVKSDPTLEGRAARDRACFAASGILPPATESSSSQRSQGRVERAGGGVVRSERMGLKRGEEEEDGAGTGLNPPRGNSVKSLQVGAGDSQASDGGLVGREERPELE